jgi:membrane-bound lytic murein transglycosylase B
MVSPAEYPSLSSSSRRLLLAALLLLPVLPASAAEALEFSDWLSAFRSEAAGLGISANTLETALDPVNEPLPRVLELDRSQPEFTQTFSAYMNNRISNARIRRGQELLQEHRELFARMEREYGVQPQYLMSFWALESNFGSVTGGFSVINALATLAWDPRRAEMFRSELVNALRIIDQGHIPAAQMSGSWAGAMGQCQFMPSTFANYAVDGDGDGRIDIWNSLPDVFASAANYLARSGWKAGERWGREVRLPADFDYSLSGPNLRKTVTEWAQLGVTRADGTALGSSDIEGSVILPAGAAGPAFLGYSNFHTTMVWNRSAFYALSVGHLADRFMGAGPIQHMTANEERALSRDEVLEMQTILNTLGFDAGMPDGAVGSRTREAARAFQLANDLPADGHASYELLATLRVLAITE